LKLACPRGQRRGRPVHRLGYALIYEINDELVRQPHVASRILGCTVGAVAGADPNHWWRCTEQVEEAERGCVHDAFEVNGRDPGDRPRQDEREARSA
jgi:hypothetical protein